MLDFRFLLTERKARIRRRKNVFGMVRRSNNSSTGRFTRVDLDDKSRLSCRVTSRESARLIGDPFDDHLTAKPLAAPIPFGCRALDAESTSRDSLLLSFDRTLVRSKAGESQACRSSSLQAERKRGNSQSWSARRQASANAHRPGRTDAFILLHQSRTVTNRRDLARYQVQMPTTSRDKNAKARRLSRRPLSN